MTKKLIPALLAFLSAWAEGALAANLGGQRDVYVDVPLSNVAVMAFNQGNYVGPALFPIVPVEKQSGMYPVITDTDWMRLPQSTVRSPKTAPRRVSFSVSSDQYNAINYALAGDNSVEDLANAMRAIRLRQNTARFVVNNLMGDMEVRIANKVTSISNIGSGVVLAAGSRWSNYANSDPIADITTGHAFIRNNTGIRANTLLLDYDTRRVVRRHPVLLDLYKYTKSGFLTDAQLMEVFDVQKILVADAIRENSKEGGASSITNIWGNIALLTHVANEAPSEETVTFGLGFRWTPEGAPAPMQARTYMDPDPGKKAEVVEVGYYQDEKIVARKLAYLVGSTL
jgi:hypothetical protein